MNLLLKSTFFSILILFIVISSSCQRNTISKDLDPIYFQIAYDVYYKEYRNWGEKNIINTSKNVYDLQSISTVLSQTNQEICDIDDLLFTNIKGGLEYKKVDCGIHTAFEKLKLKFPIMLDFQEEDYAIIRKIYYDKNGQNFLKPILK